MSRAISVPCVLVCCVLLAGCGGARYAESAPSYQYAQPAGAAYAPAEPGGMAESSAVYRAAESESGFFEGLLADTDEFGDGDGTGESYEVAQAEPPPAPTPKAPTPEEPKGTQPPTTQARVILYSASMQVVVLEMDVALEKATRLCDEVGGWVQGSTSASLTLRIPAENFRQVLAWLRELGDVADENIVGQDVTEEYFDLEIRLRNALEMRERYVELLAKAQTVKEILAIEAELGRITAEIESMKGRLRFLTEHARYSTITVYFQQASSTYSGQQHVSLPFDWLRSYNISTPYNNSNYY